MKRYFFILPFLLLGMGCTPAMPAEPVNDPAPVAVQKQPLAADPLDVVYAFCEKNGNRIVLQFDEKTKTAKPFCVFPNNTQCDAFAYQKGSCGQNNGAKLLTNAPETVATLLRTCDDTDPPVCSEDGHNYTNRCVAELQHIVVKHDGICTGEEQAETLTSENPAPVSPVQKDAQGNILPAGEKNAPPSWLPLLYQVALSYGKQSPRSFVEECKINGQLMYYYERGGSPEFSVLYRDNGLVACFPKNDITNACPTIILSGARGCKQIWRDSR